VDDGGTSSEVAHQLCEPPETLPPADDPASVTSQNGVMEDGPDDELLSIIAPPDTFCGDNSATPTPQPAETESVASGTITPRSSPCDMRTPLSPLSPKSHLVIKAPTPPVEVKRHTQLETTSWTNISRERIVTVTGGPSPRIMRITASSYKSKDSSAAESNKSYTSGAKHSPVTRTPQRQETASSKDSSKSPQSPRESVTANKQQSYEGTDM
jgi:hypothetical protein